MQRLEAWRQEGGHADSPSAIPGYAAPPQKLRTTRLPAGWDYSTLRRYAPDKAERALRSLGPKAYSAYVPPVKATREGIAVGQVIFFDDEQPDVYVNFTGVNREPMRPMGFHALDYVSACNIARGWNPQVRKADGGKTGLTETDFYWFVLSVLTRFGYRADTGTTLVVEMGTAKISDDFAKRLSEATGGKVVRDHSGRFGDPAFKGMLYEGASTGNFRYKAPIESWFNLERNYMAALPGPTGRNRDEAPEETYGLVRADKAWLRLLESLPVERRMLLQSPLMEWGAYMRTADFLVDVINARTEHEIQDWEALGFTVPELKLPGNDTALSLLPESLALLTPEMRQVVTALAGTGAAHIRRMSPSEVWQRGNKGMTRLRGWQIPALMRAEDARLLKVTPQFTLVHEDREVDSDVLTYIAKVRNEHGHEIALKRGQEYLCYLNPFAPQTLQVCEAGGTRHGAWIGEACMVPRVSRADQSGLYKLFHQVNDAVAPERADVERRAKPMADERTKRKAWNDRVADRSKPLTPNEKSDAAARAEVLAALETSSTKHQAPEKLQASSISEAEETDDADLMAEAFGNPNNFYGEGEDS